MSEKFTDAGIPRHYWSGHKNGMPRARRQRGRVEYRVDFVACLLMFVAGMATYAVLFCH